MAMETAICACDKPITRTSLDHAWWYDQGGQERCDGDAARFLRGRVPSEEARPKTAAETA